MRNILVDLERGSSFKDFISEIIKLKAGEVRFFLKKAHSSRIINNYASRAGRFRTIEEFSIATGISFTPWKEVWLLKKVSNFYLLSSETPLVIWSCSKHSNQDCKWSQALSFPPNHYSKNHPIGLSPFHSTFLRLMLLCHLRSIFPPALDRKLSYSFRSIWSIPSFSSAARLRSKSSWPWEMNFHRSSRSSSDSEISIFPTLNFLPFWESLIHSKFVSLEKTASFRNIQCRQRVSKELHHSKFYF